MALYLSRERDRCSASLATCVKETKRKAKVRAKIHPHLHIEEWKDSARDFQEHQGQRFIPPAMGESKGLKQFAYNTTGRVLIGILVIFLFVLPELSRRVTNHPVADVNGTEGAQAAGDLDLIAISYNRLIGTYCKPEVPRLEKYSTPSKPVNLVFIGPGPELRVRSESGVILLTR